MDNKYTIHDYYDNIPSVLLDCQFIEECLRMYISSSYAIAKKKLNNIVPFKYNYSDVKSDTLSVLIGKFKKLNNNQKLIEKLGIVKKHRNYIAHEAYLLTHDQQNDDLSISKNVNKLLKIKEEVNECFKETIEELKLIDEINKRL